MALFTFYTNDVKMVRKGKPEVWSIVVEGEQPELMYRGYPYVSFIPGTQGTEETIQSDKFIIDIDSGDTACKDAIKIVDWFSQVYGVEQDQWSVFLSGKKGVHLEISDTILGAENGHRLLMLAYKRLAKDIEGELDIKLDTSMYTRGVPKPYRQPNVMRDTGTCKRQIEFDDLYEIMTQEEYVFACSSPGPVWHPEDTEINNLLAEKIRHYLIEAEAQQEAIVNAPKMSDDDLDRLAAAVPRCIAILANLEKATAGNTFNNIAMQLTAYAVTAGKTEHEFMGGCQKFIAGYPSSSLNTLAKRQENCRARFRTMAANGNQHSCGGIKALRIPGYDCDECPAKQAGPEISVEVMTREDIVATSKSLSIPPEILNPGGLISLGMDALSQPGLPNIAQFNLPVVLTTIANAIAGKIVFGRVWPNVFNIKVGQTSLGKSDSDEVMQLAVRNCVPESFYGATSVASGPALLRSLVDNPKTMIVIDEATALFKRYDRPNPITDGILDTFLELYSKSGNNIKRLYSDSKQTIIVNAPCLSLTGNATPTIFEAIQQEDFETGSMQRFDFWCYDGPAMDRNGSEEPDNKKIEDFAQGIGKICSSDPDDAGNICRVVDKFKDPRKITATVRAMEMINDWSSDVIKRANAADSGGEKGIISRQYNLALKYALIHLAGTRPVEAIYLPLDETNVLYGQKVAWMLGDWKIKVLMDKITTGDFHRRCEVFKDAIRAVVRTGNRPTLKLMANRKAVIRNWNKRETDEVIFILGKRGDVLIDDSKKPTAYQLSKPDLFSVVM